MRIEEKRRPRRSIGLPEVILWLCLGACLYIVYTMVK